MGYDFNAARRALGISREQFNDLDKMDGNPYDGISEDVFSQAKRYRKFQTSENQVKMPLNRNMADIMEDPEFSPEMTGILDRGITKYNEPDKIKLVTQNAARTEMIGELNVEISEEDLKKMVLNMAKYYVKNDGKMDGCTALGNLPVDMDFVSFDLEYDYSDYSNDKSKFTRTKQEKSIPEYTRNPDAAIATITLKYKGETISISYTIPII